MKLGIMQPYIFPYIGYWQLLNAVDQFVIYDNIQYTKQGWFNRNYILMDGTRKLFTIPLKKDSDYLDVRDRYLANNANVMISKFLEQIKHAYRKAPHFAHVYPLIEEVLLNPERNLFRYLYHSIIQVKDYLKIDTEIIISSKLSIDHSLKSQEKVIEINKILGARTYINPIGGMELYSADVFLKEGIELLFLKSNLPAYKQFDHEFVPSLSIIDVMMFNSVEEITSMLRDYTYIKGD